jgi:hypothetical protein
LSDKLKAAISHMEETATTVPLHHNAQRLELNAQRLDKRAVSLSLDNRAVAF